MYYFFLGNTPDLSRLELSSLLPSPPDSVSPTILSSSDVDPTLFDRLGGTRKVAQSLTVVSHDQVVSALTTYFQSIESKNVAVTDYAGLNLTHADLIQVKKAVSHPLRFVSLDTAEHELIMLAHQHVTEVNLLPSPGGVTLAVTCWIFPAEDWVARDRAKPYRDIKRGMLPPKLARILVNLATEGKVGLSVTDPFCGTGTVLSEALLSGCNPVFGSDTFGPAVRGAQSNLDWIVTNYQLPTTNSQVYLSDATHLDQVVQQTDCIVTEPYMGPLLKDRSPFPLEKIEGIARGLDKLYRGCFKAWAPLLPTGGRVVMTIPSFSVYGKLIPTISIDTITALGYNYILSVPYGKPGVTVIRNITILEKK